ncbi:uncharacterized protein E0L32_001716 [Thyridium curvatum]|uniref:Uncharacterized protein n=1 Tax=Thyridium curvatum TaxID=1093900 RepID=A0A507ARD9_9PEZI|nr:uncharacterized protein E0L32_001483 [Thyridium curvatum]XP_030990967.1 uncharacterized protein E0L32_001716 [Thyridium curvatum]TPX09023.1 hypothetical protein E0L32_001483 [Thyridium curvatum]TPX09256.1 hypothetical protein E0L32_001716 [Thyridium curvatum]
MESSDEARRRLIQQRQMALQAARKLQLEQTGRVAQMGMAHDDIPITDAGDLSLFNGHAGTSHPDFAAFQSACRNGSFAAVEAMVTSKPRSKAYLHQGLVQALAVGNVDAAGCLLANGAPITRQTPPHVLSAPEIYKIPLFELLFQHGWTPNLPGFYGATLLPRLVTSPALLTWFLDHGADPNLGQQRDYRDRWGAPDADSCLALETAAARGTVESVRQLLDAGAKIANGGPLYVAAGACPPDADPRAGPVTPSREFDEGRIPIMALLVERGADVNGKLETRHVTAQYPLVTAVMARAVERVKWLLSRGADPRLRGYFGSAVEYAEKLGSEEMKSALGISTAEPQ